MANKATRPQEPDEIEAPSEEIDQAIDGLRGVLKKDSEGLSSAGTQADGPPASGEDFGSGDDIDGFASLPDPADVEMGRSKGGPAGTAGRHGDLKSFQRTHAADTAVRREPNIDLIKDIPIDVQVVLGTSRMPVSNLMELSEGSLIGLDRKIGEPVEIIVNGRLFGRGEITVVDSEETRFGIKLIEVIGGSDR